jgi:hypothetical protein
MEAGGEFILTPREKAEIMWQQYLIFCRSLGQAIVDNQLLEVGYAANHKERRIYKIARIDAK